MSLDFGRRPTKKLKKFCSALWIQASISPSACPLEIHVLWLLHKVRHGTLQHYSHSRSGTTFTLLKKRGALYLTIKKSPNPIGKYIIACPLIGLHHFIMDAIRRFDILDKLNDKSRQSENGECVMWTGCCKGRTVRYGVMCVNLNGGGTWKCMYVHRLALMKPPANLGLHEVLHLQSDASHLCNNSLCINPCHISVEPHWLNNSRQQCNREGICHGHAGYPCCMLALALPR